MKTRVPGVYLVENCVRLPGLPEVIRKHSKGPTRLEVFGEQVRAPYWRWWHLDHWDEVGVPVGGLTLVEIRVVEHQITLYGPACTCTRY